MIHQLLCWIGLLEVILATSMAIAGTVLTVSLSRRKVLRSNKIWLPVSILKPLKGTDSDLEKNLESFFRLNYPKFEIIFSIADENDPAKSVVEQLMTKHPKVSAVLVVGDSAVGINPKVNNLVKGYELAKYETILISDSNVRVPANYLKDAVRLLKGNVGLVTAFVTGVDYNTFGGGLEAVTLNTFCTRWMILASQTGAPVVMGKSMLFQKHVAEKFGGIKTLGRYLAEDYMAGHAMNYLGKEIAIMSSGIRQPLKGYKFKDYWSRHLRWGRLRKAQAPLAFMFEPLSSPGVVSFLAASSLWQLYSISFMHTFLIALLANFVLDLFLMIGTRAPLSVFTPILWLSREVLYFPLWLQIGAGNTVNWRGHRLSLEAGGLLK